MCFVALRSCLNLDLFSNCILRRLKRRGSGPRGSPLALRRATALFRNMAKRKSSGAPKRAAQPKVSQAPLPADAPLLDREAVAASAASRNSPKDKVRSLEAGVNKALHDNFIKKGWDPARMDLDTRLGKTLREHVREAKLKAEAGEAAIGKLFYAELRAMFEDEDHPKNKMVVLNNSEVRDARFDEASEAIIGSRMTFNRFEAIFEQNYLPPNQKTAKGFFCTLLEVPFSNERGSIFCCWHCSTSSATTCTLSGWSSGRH